MAELIQESGLAIFEPATGPSSADGIAELVIFSGPEKAVPVGERLPPWERLHHPGYWLVKSAKALYDRRKRAQQIPEKDRAAPGDSSVSVSVAVKSQLYDTYLCPEPHQEYPLPGRDGIDHSELIVDALHLAIRDFSSRGQRRAAERLKLDLAREEMQRSNWMDALHVLRPLWQTLSWRKEGWWALTEEVAWALRDCAERVGDAASIVGVEWELMCDGTFAGRRIPSTIYD
jgi:hypothetical protein